MSSTFAEGMIPHPNLRFDSTLPQLVQLTKLKTISFRQREYRWFRMVTDGGLG